MQLDLIPEAVTPPSEKSLEDLLHEAFGLREFRKGQLGIITSVLKKRDTLAVMPTGGGKSLCYQLPALYLRGLVVVVSPLISLMKDQVRILRGMGLRAGCLHSGQELDEKREVFAQIRQGGSYLLYLSPERVQYSGFTEWIKTQKPVLFAIDEAHCVSQWGPDFRQDYHKLTILRELRPDVPVLALTATATPVVLKDIGKQLGMKSPDRHVHGFYRPNLYSQVENCADDFTKLQYVKQAIRQNPEGRVLVYCGTRQQTEDLALELQREFDGVGYYHAGLDAETRKAIQEKLDRRELRILTATNAFGMGIDYPDVRLVVHVQMTANIESYYQEMGRAGRDGKMSTCLLLYSKKDKGLQSFFIQQSKAPKDVINRKWECLNAITQFCEGGECRHGEILTYFQDSDRVSECGHCDVCAPASPFKIAAPEYEEQPYTEEPERRSKRKKSAKGKKPSAELSGPEAEARKLLLKDWRREYAKEHDIPAFIVFSDRTLTDLANKNPKTLTELGRVYGFGPAKVEALGDAILRELGHR
ncbi:MAG TPA: ATP-dependent DNA helicase RecQ [Bdellovibrionales bacterium]|nr:ATP-dependent DNA helicase RecQ [Bdellovibrionales bacterium]